MNLRLIDWIWHVRGSLPLPSGQTADEAFEKLRPVFFQPGTAHEQAQDMLVFSKKDPAAQDKMSIFDGGVLRVDHSPQGPVLRYHLISRALLFCFLAPLLFLAFAQLTITVGKFEKPAAEAKDEGKKAKKDTAIQLNPIDKALGAPEPEKPKKDADKGKDKKHSPTAAYVFAAMFAALYVVGRVLEDRLVKALFRKRLRGVQA
ncbi:hypothetical protein ASE49_01445 [Novosphingobium sp. Leaf2]|nr:hypothetical protein ASE49_01445 [Novosphingobium sp. Leaf2]